MVKEQENVDDTCADGLMPELLLVDPKIERFEQRSSVDGLDGAFSSTSQSKKRKSSQLSETNVLLHELLTQWPKPSDFQPQKPADDVQLFFNSMASTVRKLSPVAIARVKLKISQIIGEEEIAWAEKIANQHKNY